MAETQIQTLESRIRESEAKITNLLHLVEQGGGMSLDSVANRLRELDKELTNLKAQRSQLIGGVHSRPQEIDGNSVRRAVVSFLEQFEKRFEQAPLPERKELLRMVVEKILVDREARKVSCYIRQLPRIDELVNLNGEGDFLLGAKGSANGNRTRISALRGPRPKPLDDSATEHS